MAVGEVVGTTVVMVTVSVSV
jgi:hypothetical protein